MAEKFNIPDTEELMRGIMRDLKVELTDEFTENFSRGAFFDKPWAKKRDGTASNLIKTGKLRRSIKARIVGTTIIFTSSEAYAAVHNSGGKYEVSRKASTRKSRRGKTYSVRAHTAHYNMPVRKFIGNHKKIEQAVEEIIIENIKKAFK